MGGREREGGRESTSDQLGCMLLALTWVRPACSWYCGACVCARKRRICEVIGMWKSKGRAEGGGGETAPDARTSERASKSKPERESEPEPKREPERARPRSEERARASQSERGSQSEPEQDSEPERNL